MAQESHSINQEIATRLPPLGSPAAQAESDALSQAGIRCLKALYAEATSKQAHFQRRTGIRSKAEWNELQARTRALERVLQGTMTDVSPSVAKAKHVLGRHCPVLSAPSIPLAQQITGGAILATSARKGIPAAAWEGLDLQIQYEQHDHEAFMQALVPDAKTSSLLAQGSTHILEHLRADVKRAIAGPPPIEELDQETAPETMFGRSPFKRLDKAHRADTAWQQETNTWRLGLELGPLLACTEYTDSETPQILETAQRLLTMPRLADILKQRFPDGSTGREALVHGPDGETSTFDQLACHPSYCHLMEGDELWNTLHSPAMDRLLNQAHHSQPLANFKVIDLHRLAMAQRIASVAIDYAVRDSIHYTFGGWKQTASEVLRARYSSCSGSTNLAVALARAARVPAGAVRMHVEAPGYFGRAPVPNVISGPRRVSVHFQVGWVTLQSDGDQGLAWKVVKSDPSDEYEVGVGLEHFNAPCSRVTHFDGTHDCSLLFAPEYVLDNVGPLVNIDPLLSKQRSLVPSISQRLELLRCQSPIKSGIRRLAVQVTQSPYEGRYDIAAQSYKRTLEALLRDPSTVAVFPGKVAQLLRAFFNDPSTLKDMLEGAIEARPWADQFLAFAKSRGMKPVHLPSVVDMAPRLHDIVQSLRSVLSTVPEDDQADLPTGLAAWAQHQRVLQISPDPSEWTRRLGQLYQFMTQCYPSNADSHSGPRVTPHWLPRSLQDRYLGYIRSSATVKSMERPLDSALCFLLGKNAHRYRPRKGQWLGTLASICNKAGIRIEEVHQLAKFHSHLLSDVATTIWERYSSFMRQHAEGIRCSTDCAVEFEAWLHRKDSVLAALHRDDLCHDPIYPETVCQYLLPRTVARTPPLIRTALREFIAMIETQPASERPTREVEMDALLCEFLGRRTGTSMASLVSERPGGWLKPYGVLYALWKVYTLPLEEAVGVATRLVRSSHEQSYLSEHDWLGEVAKSFPYRERDSTATEVLGWKAAAML